jgi:hypothetical protein
MCEVGTGLTAYKPYYEVKRKKEKKRRSLVCYFNSEFKPVKSEKETSYWGD